MGIVSGIMGAFAATQQKRAYQAAIDTLSQARTKAYGQADKMAAQFDPIVKDAMDKLGISWDTITKYLTDAENIDVGAPMNDADKIAMKDSQRLMNENMAATGNLRSGAASYANEELSRRVIADASKRQFDRQLSKSSLLLTGAGMLQGLAGTEGSMGMTGIGYENNMFTAGLNLDTQIASAQIGKGQALASGLMSFGDLGDSILSGAATAGMGGMGGLSGMGIPSGGTGALSGAAMGLNPSMMPMMMMSNYFKGTTTPGPSFSTGSNGFNVVSRASTGGGYVNAPGY